jgi:hypothetical protein
MICSITVTFPAPDVTPEVKRLLQHLKVEMNRSALQDVLVNKSRHQKF